MNEKLSALKILQSPEMYLLWMDINTLSEICFDFRLSKEPNFQCIIQIFLLQ